MGEIYVAAEDFLMMYAMLPVHLLIYAPSKFTVEG